MSKITPEADCPFRFTLYDGGIKIAWGDDPLDFIVLNAAHAKRMRRKLSEVISALAEVEGYRALVAPLVANHIHKAKDQ